MTSSSSSVNFALPDDAQAYINIIQERVRNLIDSQIWVGIEIERVEKWFSNYKNEKEQYFAARVLDALIYRSKAQTAALIDNLFFNYIPEILRANGVCSSTDVSECVNKLRGSAEPRIRIVPVIRDDDPPTKSGPLVARIVKRHLRLRDRWMIWPFNVDASLKSGVNVFIFIDDFLGTGTQFVKFEERYSLNKIFKQSLCIYAPLAACGAGVLRLREEYPELVVISADILSESMNIFSEESECFNDGVNTAGAAQDFYDALLERISGKARGDNKQPYGFGHLGVTYAFEHASPNASIPLLWYEYDNFVPLFDR